MDRPEWADVLRAGIGRGMFSCHPGGRVNSPWAILMKKFLTLEFLPRSVDLGLLVLRIGLGASLFALHGWGKLKGLVGVFGGGEVHFPNVLGIGSLATLILAVFAEIVCSTLVILGLWTRFAAVFVIATTGCAFVFAHKMALTGPRNGELPFLFLIGFVVLLLAGAGKYSFDKK